ncbi:hypothetical protein ASE14_11985 [Agromyces sp. Root81]|uniref:hypothetical protein n=1 Tax=Agromyces sp. Root81 TaxID=1736601 RepID=UPI0006F1C69B|nr:hypothetical protein [Agromyces sp. Root81]KRC61560.1 hypothetical protein ASE14_11985 [Agromyces sp. Root81]
MQLIVGWIVAIAGASMFWWSTRMLLRANRGRRVPYLSNPAHVPSRSIMLRSIGAGAVVLGAALLAPEIGISVMLLVALAFAPSLLWIPVHNRRAAK